MHPPHTRVSEHLLDDGWLPDRLFRRLETKLLVAIVAPGVDERLIASHRRLCLDGQSGCVGPGMPGRDRVVVASGYVVDLHIQQGKDHPWSQILLRRRLALLLVRRVAELTPCILAERVDEAGRGQQQAMLDAARDPGNVCRLNLSDCERNQWTVKSIEVSFLLTIF